MDIEFHPDTSPGLKSVHGVAIWEWELATDLVSVSGHWKKLRGFAPQDSHDLVARSLDSVHEDDRAELKTQRASLVQGLKTAFALDYRVRMPSGSCIWIEERCQAVRDQSGKVVRLVGCEIDITNRKQDELMLNDFLLRSAVEPDALPVAICKFEDRHCVYVNEFWSKLTGRPRETALGDGWIEAIHPDDRESVLTFKEAHQHGQPGSVIVVDGINGRHLNPDGSIKWFVAKSRITYGEDGEVASAIVTVFDVSESKQLEQQEARLVEILEATPDYVGIASPQREILWHNRRLKELRPDLSKPEDQSDFSVGHPEWSRKIMEEVAIPTAIEHGSWSGEMAIFDMDGNEIPVSQVLIAQKDANGELEALSTIMRDIRHQKETERALRESQNMFSRLAATAPIAIFRMEADPTGCTYVNDRWGELTQRSPESALGAGWQDAIHPEDLKQITERMKDFAGDPTRDTDGPREARHLLPDGSVRWVLASAAKEKDDQGNVTGYVGTLIDINELKQAEQKLAQFDQRFRRVLEFSCIGVWEWSFAQETLSWDSQMFKIYGVDPEDFQGLHVDWEKRVHPDDLDRTRTYQAQKGMAGENAADEFRIVRSDGELRHIYSNVYIETDEHGEPTRAIGINMDITDRREAELALLDSENKFQRIAAHVPGMVYRYVVHTDGSEELTYVSSKVEELYGVSLEDALADVKKLWHRNHPDDLGWLLAETEASAKDLTPFLCEHRILHPEKGQLWLQTCAQPVRLENGDVVWDGIQIDITNHKRAELALQEANTQIERMTENIPGMVYRYVYRADGTHAVSYISTKCRELFEVEPAEAMANADCLYQWIHPDDRDRINEAVQRSSEKLHPFKEEYRVVLPKQGLRWRQSIGQPTRNDAEETVWDGMVLDVTDRKEAQLELQQAKNQIERITDNLLGMICRYVFRADGSSSIAYVSSHCLEMFEVSQQEAIENPNLLVEMIVPEDREELREKLGGCIESLQPFKHEYRVDLPRQGLRWRQSIGQLARLDNGDTIWDGVILDITDRKSAELALQSANEELAKATRMKDEFLANMSHELRTPLSAILGMAEGLQEEIFGALTERQRSSLATIEQSGQHLLQLIDEILDLAKIEAGGIELNLTEVNIMSLCESSLQVVSQAAQQKDLELCLNVHWNLPSIQADEKRLRQVLINLLSNAIKFTPASGTVSLEVRRIEQVTDSNDTVLRISVRDTGLGIDEAQLEAVFQPFVQGDQSLSRGYDGVGLGLALVKRFVGLHAGEVRATSEIGKGSCFTIDLPYRHHHSDHRGNKPTEQLVDHGGLSEQSTQNGKVLLVEDSESVAASVIAYLTSCRFEVRSVSDGISALQVAQEFLPDVILMDIQIPRLDGLETIRKIRQVTALGTTPIIALTGRAMPDDEERCLEAGADRYLSKPAGVKDLVQMITQLLQDRQ